MFHRQQRILNCQNPSSTWAHKEKINKSATHCSPKKGIKPWLATHQHHLIMKSSISLSLSLSGVHIPVINMNVYWPYVLWYALASARVFCDSMLNSVAADATRYYHALKAPVELGQIQLKCSGGENKRAFSIWNGDLETQKENRAILWPWNVRSPWSDGEKAFFCYIRKIATVFQPHIFAKHHPVTPRHVQYACVCVRAGRTPHTEGQCSYCQLPHKGSFQVSPGRSLSTSHSHSSFLPLLQPSRSDACLLCFQ